MLNYCLLIDGLDRINENLEQLFPRITRSRTDFFRIVFHENSIRNNCVDGVLIIQAGPTVTRTIVVMAPHRTCKRDLIHSYAKFLNFFQ